jgi:hypothetical protein
MASIFVDNLAHTASLTAFLGGKTAESLILGSRGAPGLPWAAISSFGSFHLIKACLAASIPCWLRETLGGNTPICQAILGKSSMLDNTSMLKVPTDTPQGICVRHVSVSDATSAFYELHWHLHSSTTLTLCGIGSRY